MRKYYELLKSVPLFKDIDEEEFANILTFLSAIVKKYDKNEFIYITGEPVSSIGIVLSGGVQIIKEDILGNRNILTDLGKGEIFAEAFSCAQIDKFPVTVMSTTDSEVMFINFQKVLQAPSNTCGLYGKLIENMVRILANKNVVLNQKIEYLSKRTTREKLMAYLSSEALKAGRNRFTLPFNRQELADYLCVDRSAMSSELGRMRDQGLIIFHGSHFEIL